MDIPLRTLEIRFERDVVRIHQTVRWLAECLNLDLHERSRLATAASEICRNAYKYAGGGKAELSLRNDSEHPILLVTVTDQGRGIAKLEEVLGGTYVSSTGLGLGISGARRLMDVFEISSSAKNGTRVVLGKTLVRQNRYSDKELAKLIDRFNERREDDPFNLIRQQNTELMQALEQLRTKQEELNQSNTELAETNRGVVALYRELDDKSQALQKASEVKGRFLSHVSHELRTPVYSILALSRILLDRSDGELSSEQEKQVTFIRRAAENLQEMIDELLDLAKIEAGRVSVNAAYFDVPELFSALRGMMRPLLNASGAVVLLFESAPDVSTIFSDEGKVSQILRNLLSNAIKFTEAGEIRVNAELAGEGKIRFRVTDTGMGIPPEDQARIFEEFAQVEGPHQRKVKGTGLGLPVSRKLAEILGGTLNVESQTGLGSAFTLVIPSVPTDEAAAAVEPAKPTHPQPVLVIDDDEISRYLFRDVLRGSPLELLEAENGTIGLRIAREKNPAVIFLDLLMPGHDGIQVLEELRRDPRTRNIPVVINSTRTLESSEEALLRQKAIAIVRKNFVNREDAAREIRSALDIAFRGEAAGV